MKAFFKDKIDNRILTLLERDVKAFIANNFDKFDVETACSFVDELIRQDYLIIERKGVGECISITQKGKEYFLN